MNEVITFIQTSPTWLTIAMAVLFVSKLITIFTPTKLDDRAFGVIAKVLNPILKTLNITSLNIFQDKNADSTQLAIDKKLKQ